MSDSIPVLPTFWSSAAGKVRSVGEANVNVPSVLSARVTPDSCLPFGTCDHLRGYVEVYLRNSFLNNECLK